MLANNILKDILELVLNCFRSVYNIFPKLIDAFSQSISQLVFDTDIDFPDNTLPVIDWLFNASLIEVLFGGGITFVIVYSLVKWVIGLVTG